MNQPFVAELSPAPDPGAALARCADLPGVLLLESALRRPRLGRCSFLTADPFETFEVRRPGYGEDPFGPIAAALDPFRIEPIADLPPFQGGAAGLLGYELGGAWERIPVRGGDDLEIPALAVGVYDWVIAWDHQRDRAWIVSHGFPETDPATRAERAQSRLRAVRARLAAKPASGWPALGSTDNGRRTADGGQRTADIPGLPGLTSDFSREEYLAAVARVIEYIRAGDVFQANLSQRLMHPLRERPLDLYARLRRVNPAPMAGYFAWDDWAIASASPERFVRVEEGGEVETRPIKGTRRRRSLPEADLFTRDELRESVKDQAENVMIVDLMRNDLSRVCRPGSIRVPRLCAVETYETVQHLVSEVRGTLAEGRSVWDLFAATFPGGSITGAPKVRAMEIIAELEPTVRGPYCGSLFYAGFDGRADSSILIRTFAIRRGRVQCGVGGGIVAQSDPADEYAETLHKAEGMLRALRGASNE
ncbi:MAG: aminodeoxychorismate synthase component I [Planctomycetales bacterium]